MEWHPYQACCHQSALRPDDTFCAECGNSLLRCMAYRECFGLVEPTGACPICIAPELSIEAGATTSSAIGDRLSVPLVLKNNSSVRRPLLVTGIRQADANGNFIPVSISWETLAAGQERPFSITTAALDAGGTRSIELLITVCSRYKAHEERYVYSGHIDLRVHSGQATNIVQNIEISGTGGMYYDRSQRDVSGSVDQALGERSQIALYRAELPELEEGVRGYRNTRVRLPRNVLFHGRGFAESDCPATGMMPGTGGVIKLGRNSRNFNSTNNPHPNDICLRVYHPASKETNLELSRSLSRHVLDLLVQNDRLYLQCHAGAGIQINNSPLGKGEFRSLNHGDTIHPLPTHPQALALQLTFESSASIIDSVNLTRLAGHC